MEIDPRKLKLPDHEWMPIQDAFILKAVPIWFEWLNWVLILGALGYLSDKTRSVPVIIIHVISYILFQLYFFSFFSGLRLKREAFKSPRVAHYTSLVFSILITVGTWWILSLLVQTLTERGAE